MKKFETITEYEILTMAWIKLSEKIWREEERNEKFQKEHGRTNNISEYQLRKYREQRDEIHERILEIEEEK